MIIASIIGWWKIFEKAGERPWKRLIPFYGTCVSFDLADSPGYFVIYIMSVLYGALNRACYANSDGYNYREVGIGYTHHYIVERDDWYFIFGYILVGLGILVSILYAIAMVRLARNFGKNGWFALGLILLPPVFLCILGFGSAKYKELKNTAFLKPKTKTDANIAYLKPRTQTDAVKSNHMNADLSTQRKPVPELKKDVIISTVIPEGKVSCPKCGEIQPKSRNICWNCGEKLSKEEMPSETIKQSPDPDFLQSKKHDQFIKNIDNIISNADLEPKLNQENSFEKTIADKEPVQTEITVETISAEEEGSTRHPDLVVESTGTEVKSNEVNPSELLYCRYCGFKLLEHSDFCSHCGRKVR